MIRIPPLLTDPDMPHTHPDSPTAQHGSKARPDPGRPGNFARQSQRPPRQVVIVDPDCDRYPEFVAEAAAGRLGLHFCTDARAALRLARRFEADAWVVRTDLPDMDGLDLLPLLTDQISQSQTVRRTRSGFPVRRVGIFLAAGSYSADEEEQALAGGSAGYLVHPITADLLSSIASVEAGTAS